MLGYLRRTPSLAIQGLLVGLVLPSEMALGQTPRDFDKRKKYDSNGNVIESVGLFPDGTVAETYYSEYDSSNRLVRSYTIKAGSSDKEWINVYRYGRKERLKERLWYASERMLLYRRERYRYDRFGNLIEIRRYDNEGKLVSKEEWRCKDGVVMEHTIEPPPPEPIPCEHPPAQ